MIYNEFLAHARFTAKDFVIHCRCAQTIEDGINVLYFGFLLVALGLATALVKESVFLIVIRN